MVAVYKLIEAVKNDLSMTGFKLHVLTKNNPSISLNHMPIPSPFSTSLPSYQLIHSYLKLLPIEISRKLEEIQEAMKVAKALAKYGKC